MVNMDMLGLAVATSSSDGLGHGTVVGLLLICEVRGQEDDMVRIRDVTKIQVSKIILQDVIHKYLINIPSSSRSITDVQNEHLLLILARLILERR